MRLTEVIEYTKDQIEEYNYYKKQHIKHWQECPQCRGDTIKSNLYEGWRECVSCRNSNGEGRPVQEKPPKTIEEYINSL